MQIMIDIPKYVYDTINEMNLIIDTDSEKVAKAVKNGVVLLGNHGRLIDADKLAKNYGIENAKKYGNKDSKEQTLSYSTLMLYEIADMIENAETIIEAYNIREEKKNEHDISTD